MGHVKPKQTLEVSLELIVSPILVVLVARAGFEQEYRQTSCQVGRQLVGRCLFARVIDLPHPVKQVGEMLANGDEQFNHQFPFFSLWLVGLALLDRGQAQLGFPCAICGLVQVRIGFFLVKRILVCLKSMEKSNFGLKQPDKFISTRFYPVDFST